jgi:hypothetical protein
VLLHAYAYSVHSLALVGLTSQRAMQADERLRLYHAGYIGQVTCTNAVSLGSDIDTTLQIFVRLLLHASVHSMLDQGPRMDSLDLLTK